ncbi:glutamic acid-rich protein-like [Eucalyptus grandis]|uniref:glutamic acid-rich protein-like n=1 Tax=Eucalyptus grandis TaxID=71139 RepID=UPI000527B8EF|nr:glutamic acid-rich protein-like [Eucalyptus grandis]
MQVKYETKSPSWQHLHFLVLLCILASPKRLPRDNLIPHKYRSWYHHYHDGRRECPIPEGDVPLYVLETAFGLGTADPKDGSVVDAKDPKLESDPKSLVYSAEGTNYSKEKREIVGQEERPEEDQEWDWPEEKLAEEEPVEGESEEEDPEEDESDEDSEEEEDDPEEDLKYDLDED